MSLHLIELWPLYGAEVSGRSECQGETHILVRLLCHREEDACVLSKAADVEVGKLVAGHFEGAATDGGAIGEALVQGVLLGHKTGRVEVSLGKIAVSPLHANICLEVHILQLWQARPHVPEHPHP